LKGDFVKQGDNPTEHYAHGGGRMQQGVSRNVKAHNEYVKSYMKIREQTHVPPILINFIVYTVAFLLAAAFVIALVIIGTS
jgi:hypothetical protein